ncbi:hypothetical protein [Flavobacterium oreochromis]|uniref:Uncharacterized protein n=1 Tax=Flavobacterium columnare TaxID=996 RepID=A0A246G7C6_9FLAO|nr:hypothetical protein [Flavobacterium oreochromis]OWP74315.1 hypothetical protein BWK62_14600 [Flavobacterium oreochromis]
MKAKIRILQKLETNIKLFENHDQKPAVFNYYCSNCHTLNTVSIDFFQISRDTDELLKSQILTEEEILKQKMLVKDSTGELVVDNALYSSRYITEECKFCSQKILIVFGLGEPNPNRFVCKIAGVWSYEEK